MSVIKLENMSKSYGDKNLFKEFNLEIAKGEFVGIKGESGKGKSTLLNIMGLLESCEGKVHIDGKEVHSKDSRSVGKILKNRIGYLFQNFALIDDLDVFENLRIVLSGVNRKQSRQRILAELNKVGLEDAIDKKVYQLSGGEQQRVALVRLILQGSEIILADEPTGSLDHRNADTILSLLKELHVQGKTIVMVSHDERAFSHCTRVIELS